MPYTPPIKRYKKIKIIRAWFKNINHQDSCCALFKCLHQNQFGPVPASPAWSWTLAPLNSRHPWKSVGFQASHHHPQWMIHGIGSENYMPLHERVEFTFKICKAPYREKVCKNMRGKTHTQISDWIFTELVPRVVHAPCLIPHIVSRLAASQHPTAHLQPTLLHHPQPEPAFYMRTSQVDLSSAHGPSHTACLAGVSFNGAVVEALGKHHAQSCSFMQMPDKAVHWLDLWWYTLLETYQNILEHIKTY